MPQADVLGRPYGYVVAPEDRHPVVTDWTGYDDYLNAPPNYEIFYRQYYRYTRTLVLKFAPPRSDFEDIVSDIIMRFLERDSLGVFSREWSSRSASGRSGFRSYFSRFVVTYARGYTRNSYSHHSRYMKLINSKIFEDWPDFFLMPCPRTMDEVTELALDNVEFGLFVRRIIEEFSDDHFAVLLEILLMALDGQEIRHCPLAKTLGISIKESKLLVRELRDATTRAHLHTTDPDSSTSDHTHCVLSHQDLFVSV